MDHHHLLARKGFCVLSIYKFLRGLGIVGVAEQTKFHHVMIRNLCKRLRTFIHHQTQRETTFRQLTAEFRFFERFLHEDVIMNDRNQYHTRLVFAFFQFFGVGHRDKMMQLILSQE